MTRKEYHRKVIEIVGLEPLLKAEQFLLDLKKKVKK